MAGGRGTAWGPHRVPAGGDQLADGRGRALRQLEPQVVLRHFGHHALAQAAPALQVGKRDLLRQQLPQDDGVAVHVGRLAVALVQQNLRSAQAAARQSSHAARPCRLGRRLAPQTRPPPGMRPMM